MRYLALTVDYEIFGNGTGDVRQHVTEPTEHMARTLERVGAPLTVFVEMEEQVAFEKHAPALRARLGYDPGALIRHQIADLAPRGHDFQLHLHPEWHRCSWSADGWQLHRHTHTVDALYEEQDAVTKYIRDRKTQLENYAGQRVTSYRCGAFAAQPGRKLLHALAENDFVIESSVVCGMRRDEPTVQLDYRNAPRTHRSWRVREDVAQPDATGAITELPIHSVMGRRFHQITGQRLRAKFSRNVPKQGQNEMLDRFGLSKRRPWSLLKFLWQPVPLKLDFHNVTPRKLMQWIRSAPAPHPDDPLDLLVLIGHTKEHINPQAFEEFVRLASADPEIKIVSLTQVAEMLRQSAGGTGRAATRGAALSGPLE
jgi:hypothetical protein